MNSKPSSLIKIIFKYTVLLLIVVSSYQILYVHVLISRYPVSITFVMFLLPIFAYLLQQSIQLNTPHQVKWYQMILYSMLMIWLMAISFSVIRYVAYTLELDWIFAPKELDTGHTPLILIIKRYLMGYTLYGLPSAFLAYLVLFLKQKFGRKH